MESHKEGEAIIVIALPFFFFFRKTSLILLDVSTL
jgi:hypothetical protein